MGKSTLFQTVLGQRALTRGSVEVEGTIGYIPQQRMFPANLPIRARDLVGLSTAHGVFRNRRPRREQIDAALAEVGAAGLADRRVGKMSGGQQQLIRQAQALAGDPEILLCDEPLLSMDLRAQRATVELLERQRRKKNAAVLFITHNINPILEVTDRVLYITPHGHRQGTVAEVMNTETLSELYQTEVKVIEVDGKLIVL